MVIDPNNIANAGSSGAKSKPASVEPANATVKANSKAPATSSNADSVFLSAEAQSLGKVEAAITATPDVNSEKVAAVRSAIESGQYRVDPQAIAEKIANQDPLI